MKTTFIKVIITSIIIFGFGLTSQASAVLYISQPCDLVNGAFSITNSEYNINRNRTHSSPHTGALDLGGNGGQPLPGNSYQRCNGLNAIASISGTVKHIYDNSCGGHTHLRIEGEDDVTVDYLHVDINAANTVPNNSEVFTGQVIGTISDKGCTGSPPFTHIHLWVRQAGQELSYSAWKFKDTCIPPSSGDWIIESQCVIDQDINFDFRNNHILIKAGYSLKVVNGAKIY